VESGFYVEVLTEPFSCFDPQNYQTLLIIDPEDYFSQAEISKLRHDFEWQGLSLIIIADWYN
jgi:membrane-bound transcription factor site-1 protease